MDDRRAGRPVDGFEFPPEAVTGGGVERRERFIQEEDARTEDKCPCDRGPLLLTAGERSRCAPEEMADPEHVSGLRDQIPDSGRISLLLPETKPYVLLDGQVRKEHVVLVDHTDPPIFWFGVGDIPIIEADRPCLGCIDPRDRLKEDRLPRSGRPEDDEVLSVDDGQIYAVE